MTPKIEITPNPTTRLEITDIVWQKVFEKNPFGQGVANYIDLSYPIAIGCKKEFTS